jgi:hypothetical protein
VLWSTERLGAHPPSDRCAALSHAAASLPRGAAVPVARFASNAYTVGSVHEPPLPYGQPPSGFWAAAIFSRALGSASKIVDSPLQQIRRGDATG